MKIALFTAGFFHPKKGSFIATHTEMFRYLLAISVNFVGGWELENHTVHTTLMVQESGVHQPGMYKNPVK